MALDTGNALITIAEFKNYIGDSTGSTSYEDRYADIINSASWRFNSYTRRSLKARSHTEYRDGNGTQEIHTREFPINDNSTSIDIRIDTDRDYDTGDKVSSSGIIIYSSEGKIYLDDDVFESGRHSVKIVYSGGYSTIPHDLAYACKEYCKLQWKREQKNDPGSVRSESYEGGSITYEPDLPWSVKRILDLHKKIDIEA